MRIAEDLRLAQAPLRSAGTRPAERDDSLKFSNPQILKFSNLEAPMPSPNPQSQEQRPARILIADDDPQGVELLEAYLAGTDYDVQTAGDGEQALQKVKGWHPDVILLDIMMPKISGFEVAKRLRANAATADIVILMITALDQPSDIDRAVEAGTMDFLTKPINKTDLLVRVRSALESRRGKAQLGQTLAYIEGVERGG